jgi:hypothetical protein
MASLAKAEPLRFKQEPVMDKRELAELKRKRKVAELILSITNANATIRYLIDHPEIIVPADLVAINRLFASAKRWLNT